jgi:hypothetical protein
MRRRGEVDELWAALADPTKHLAVLDRAGLADGDRRAREVRYVVRPKQLDAAARALARVAAQWDERLLAIKRIAESSAREQSNSAKEIPQ